MVTEEMMRIKVITLTNARGRLACPAPGNALNTTLGSGQKFCEKRMVPYEIRNAPKVKASLIKKYHIISFPYSRLKGLLPPFHQFVFVTVACVAIIEFRVYCFGLWLYKPFYLLVFRQLWKFAAPFDPISSKLQTILSYPNKEHKQIQ